MNIFIRRSSHSMTAAEHPNTPRTDDPTHVPGGVASTVPAALVLVAALAARAAVNFANVTPGGMDAGYYPIQARALVETGSLLYRDVPLYHYAAAGLAHVLVALGFSLDGAVLLSSKALDTALPLGLGIAVLLMALAMLERPRTAPRPARAGWAAIAAPIALGVLSAPAMRMVSDFQKQAAAMTLLALAVWACRGALASRSVVTWAGVALLLALTGLTHAGTFAAAGLTLACIVGVYAVAFARLSPARLGALGLAGVLLAAGLFAAVYFADQGKALGLVRGLAKLTRLSSWFDSGGASGRDGSARPPHGPGGPMGGFDPVGLGVMISAHVGGVWTFLAARRARDDAPAADRAVALGCALSAMLLASPLLSGDYFMRLSLMAPAPLAVALAFVLTRRSSRGRHPWPAVAILGASVLSALVPLTFLVRPMISRDGVTELAAMKPVVGEHPGTVVIARHGLEFWAAYFLHANVRTGPGQPAELARFGRILQLTEIDNPMGRGPGGPRGPNMRPPGMGPPGMGPPRDDRPPRARDDGPMPMPGFGPSVGPPMRLGPPLYRGKVFSLAEREPDQNGHPER
jgi:hypothetical protein